MEWLPSLDIDIEKYDECLNDFELHMVKELKRSLRNYPKGPERARIQKEMLEIYKSASQRNKDENKKYELERLWNQILQKTFEQMSRIMANLLGTLVLSGIVSLFFIAVVVLGFSFTSPTSYEDGLAILIYAIGPFGIINIVVGFISYKRMRQLKKNFENGELRHLE